MLGLEIKAVNCPACGHPEPSPRRVRRAKNRVAYYMQCTFCGAVGPSVERVQYGAYVTSNIELAKTVWNEAAKHC